jgi:MFS family permease
MYSEQDLRDAVAAGAISEEAAAALRNHVAAVRQAPSADEESFRLVTSFNDIFVTIAAIILLVAMGGIGNAIAPVVGSVLAAAASWAMAEFFTLKRRMALPSIVLLLSFVGGVLGAGFELMSEIVPDGTDERIGALLIGGVFLLGAAAAWFHWRRFKVPITVAAGAAARAGLIITLVVAATMPLFEDAIEKIILPLVFASSLAVFAYAMRWDMTDPVRETRRSDVAFWLHLLAAPMIAHPLFYWLGVFDGAIGALGAIVVLAVYVLFGIVALAVDRRALLVSALAYVLYAMGELIDQFGVVELNVAVTALVIGSALLTLSAFWTSIRNAVLAKLPDELRARLPAGGVLRPA